MAYEILETCLLVPGVSDGDCSGWVQAWGSLLGLGVAIALPARQRYLDAKKHRAAESVRAQIVGMTLAMQLQQIAELTKPVLIHFDQGIPVWPADLSAIRTELEPLIPTEEQVMAIQPVEHKLAVLLAQIRVTSFRVCRDCDRAASGSLSDDERKEVVAGLKTFLKSVRVSSLVCERRLNDFLKATGVLSTDRRDGAD